MKIIMGKINASNTFGFWNTGKNYTPDVSVGDYAIVENRNDYDLIKIIGILETNEKYEKFLAPHGVSKEVVQYYARSMARHEYGNMEEL